jgi:assimilatory nitrate reductase catalytic subunit
VDPPGEAKADFDIFLALAEKLGVRQFIYPGWSCPEDAFEEWRRVSEGRLCDYSGLSYELLDRFYAVQWPFTKDDANGLKECPPQSSRLYTNGQFQTANGKAFLWSVDWEAFTEQPNNNYPFILNTGRTVEHWHTRTKTKEVKILERLSPTAWLEMNPRDARHLGLRPHDRVRVVSQRGSVDQLELRITEIVAPGQVFMPFHYEERNSNELTQSVFDALSREPNYKQCAVRIEKAGKT